MEKMRCESLEALIGIVPEKQLVKMAFQVADECVRDLRKIGIEVDFIKTVILKDKEFHREDSEELT